MTNTITSYFNKRTVFKSEGVIARILFWSEGFRQSGTASEMTMREYKLSPEERD